MTQVNIIIEDIPATTTGQVAKQSNSRGNLTKAMLTKIKTLQNLLKNPKIFFCFLILRLWIYEQ